MTSAEMLAEIDAHGFEAIDVETKLLALNDAIGDICQLEPWPFLEAVTDLTYDGTEAVSDDWPSNIRAVVSLSPMNSGRELFYVRLDQVDKFYGATVSMVGVPQAYFLQASVVNIVPMPRVSDVIRLRFLQKPEDVTEEEPEDPSIFPKELHMAAVYGALVNLFMHDDDVEMSDKMAERRDTRVSRARDGLWRPNYDAREIIEITDQFDDYC